MDGVGNGKKHVLMGYTHVRWAGLVWWRRVDGRIGMKWVENGWLDTPVCRQNLCVAGEY